MKRYLPGSLACLLFTATCTVFADPAARVIERFEVPGIRQGVAVDAEHLYIISNHELAKYSRTDKSGLETYACEEGKPFIHFNAGFIHEDELWLAHSNHPGVPMTSSVEVFSPDTLQPLRSISLGVEYGSLTWIDFHEDNWYACFANYSKKGGTPGRGHEHTLLVKMNEAWQKLESWVFPATVLDRFDPYSSSGGSFGPDGHLYVTGHDLPEIYVMRLPDAGSTLEYLATVEVPFHGQAWAWDRQGDHPRVVYAIDRPTREVVVCEIPELPTTP
ncbi:MAG: hypothetical protein R6V45_08970 [Oceanipulchritudo sp.]